MRLKSYLAILFVSFVFLPSGALFAQESCSEDNKTALDACVQAAIEKCENDYPGCENEPISVEDALEQFEEKCGLCDSYKNFGQYVKCLKHFVKSLKMMKAYSADIKDALNGEKSTCKAEQKEKKKNKKGNGKGKGNS